MQKSLLRDNPYISDVQIRSRYCILMLHSNESLWRCLLTFFTSHQKNKNKEGIAGEFLCQSNCQDLQKKFTEINH